MGSSRDRELGAGTYGYGKSALYRFSRCGTIFAYTRTTCAGKEVARLMAATIDDAYEYQGRRYTGRHWWGIRKSDNIVDPLESSEGHSIAESLGIQHRKGGNRGTSILIVDPDIEERSAAQVGNATAECLAWFFWPKMVARENGTPAMVFEVLIDDEAPKVVDARDLPPLPILIEAFGVSKGSKARVVSCERPIQRLGRLGLARGPRLSRRNLDTGSEALIPEHASCVALMRPAELVVKYLKGPALPSDLVEYAGVFICDAAVEQHFADAEPPAHDDWIPDFLEGRAKTFVRVAMRKVASQAEQFALPPQGQTASPAQQSLAALGDALGNVLLGQPGVRLGGGNDRLGPKARKPTSRGKKISISDPEPFRFAVVKRVPCAIFRLKITSVDNSTVTLEAKPFVVLEGGSLVVPDGPDAPKIIGWLDAKGDLVAQGRQVKRRTSGVEFLHVAVSVREDTAVAVRVESLDAK